MKIDIITDTPDKTKNIAKNVAKLILPGDIILFFGELGAGKTCFTQGIAEELEVKEYVNSPSFTIINEYSGKMPIYHFDLFRLNNYHEFDELGYEEYFYGKGLAIVEWSEKIVDYLPKKYLKIAITFIDMNKRKISISSKNKRYIKLIEELKKNENIRD